MSSKSSESGHPVPGNPHSAGPLQIGRRWIGSGNPVFIIAEAGTSHMGDISHARELIDAAAESGADCVKFQWVIADEIVHPRAGSIELPGGPVPIWQRFRQLERPASFYAELKEYTEERGLFFLCSPFGTKSARQLLALEVEAVKIASPELNHYPLLQAVSGLPLIISTGVSELRDIERCLAYLGGAGHTDGSAVRTALLHCITAYPAPEEEYNLRVVPLLSTLFGVPAGLSDHSKDPLVVPLLALSQGASIIEKHFTLSHGSSGLDDPIALDPGQFASMSRHLREGEHLGADQLIEECRREFSEQRVEAVLGSGKKTLAPSEARFYRSTNRSIVALEDLEPGEIISRRNSALLRSEQNRTAGLEPHHWESVIGREVKTRIPAGEGIVWELLLSR
ncbi:MAG: N-acetylneuraminate synthase family protein [Sediminispirochaetaceae bacterium]